MEIRQAGDVPARARKTGNQPGPKRIRRHRKDDGSRLPRLLHSPNRGIAVCHDDIHLQANELRGEPGERFEPGRRIALLDDDVLAFDVPQLLQPSLKRSSPALRGVN